jgi:hypothetical protein
MDTISSYPATGKREDIMMPVGNKVSIEAIKPNIGCGTQQSAGQCYLKALL